MEFGHLPYKKRTYEKYVGRLERDGKKKWQRRVVDVVERNQDVVCERMRAGPNFVWTYEVTSFFRTVRSLLSSEKTQH